MSLSANPTIGILTGGGDVPGLNPCIKQLVMRAREAGMRVIGIRKGWEGLLAYTPGSRQALEEYTTALTPENVRTIDRSGGTILHTSRTNPAAVSHKDAPDFLKTQFDSPTVKMDFTSQVLENLAALGIDCLVPIGGDDTLSFALRLHEEGFPVVAIPKTMDNDVSGTDYCIGFSTAITRSVNFIHALRTSAGSHERIAVVELFGRYCGETSLIAAYLSGADRAIISEVPFQIERLAELMMGDHSNNPSRYAMMTISEGARMTDSEMLAWGEADAYGHRKLSGIGAITAEGIKKITGIGIIYQPLSYLMRSGSPDSLDLMVGLNFANMAIELIRNKTVGKMVALCRGCYTSQDLQALSGQTKRVDVEAYYDSQAYRPNIKSLSARPMFLT